MLDYNQKKVVLNNDQYLLVIAGAGSGKTYTIIQKIHYLIDKKKLKEEEILCLSFTNETCLSLKNKLKENYNYDLDVKTFHKLALELISNEYSQIKVAPADFLNVFTDFFLKEKIFSYPLLMKLVLKIFKIKYTKNNFKKKYQEFILEEKYPKLLKTIINFINLFKSFNYSNDYFQKIIKKALKKEQYFLLITYSIYLDYNNELSSLGLIDFNDMLIKACNLNFNLKYKYIIVDEYQDTSLVRYQLLKAIIQKTNAKLMVVGDDYQSIYHFSGCTLEIFINFAKYFKQAKILYLNTTYRNSQELVDVATDFIRQNKKQIPKEMISLNHHFKPIKLVYYHNLKKDLTSLILKLANLGSLLILGRNNFDIYKYLDQKIFSLNKNGNISFKNQNVRFLTVHKSKGLEADYVIILNLENDPYGFPSKLIDNKILKYVNPLEDDFPFAEERRLFYVALTRCKKEVYLYVNKYNESIFVKELKKRYKKSIEKFKISDTYDKD